MKRTSLTVRTGLALAALAVHMPGSDEELLKISGIGEVKLERYGAAVLAALAG